eukprot:GFKZ01015754.1.p2 GENE.GFKZ01015754.1~~GFKZ01015754.1.p2  ORF type:complete len:110 (+),score=4.64 GFKZ01015754.1:530-859(+)
MAPPKKFSDAGIPSMPLVPDSRPPCNHHIFPAPHHAPALPPPYLIDLNPATPPSVIFSPPVPRRPYLPNSLRAILLEPITDLFRKFHGPRSLQMRCEILHGSLALAMLV